MEALRTLIPELSAWQWTLGALCAFFVGVAKTGMPGLGILIVPLMVLTVGDARHSAGWLLPLLCLGDLFAVAFWRRHAVMRQLLLLAPWVLGGIALGAAALSLSERVLRPVVGGIVLAMLAVYLRRRLRPDTFPVPSRPAPWGVTAGFATTVANAAGPVMNLYLLSMQLPKEQFIGTGAWFFFFINLTKVPIYAWHGIITPRSLTYDACMIPMVAMGALSGRWLFQRLPQHVFEAIVLALTVLSTLLLFR